MSSRAFRTSWRGPATAWSRSPCAARPIPSIWPLPPASCCSRWPAGGALHPLREGPPLPLRSGISLRSPGMTTAKKFLPLLIPAFPTPLILIPLALIGPASQRTTREERRRAKGSKVGPSAARDLVGRLRRAECLRSEPRLYPVRVRRSTDLVTAFLGLDSPKARRTLPQS